MIESPLLEHLTCYIGGRWANTESDEVLAVTNPATGETLAEVASAGANETRDAIEAGKKALNPDPDLETRRGWVASIRDVLREEQDEVGRILCLEHGKPLQEAKGEVEYAAGFFDYCAKNIDALQPYTLKDRPKNCTWTVYHRPIGVVGQITPWNFPIGMIAKKLCASLAVGCPCVIKPAEDTPLTMIALFHLLDERLDLPPGMVNMVVGRDPVPIGDTLCAHPDVPMISFTGSTGVGKHLIDATSNHVKKLGLELGGNAPFIVFEDADLERAADDLMASKFRGSGQTCVCANRIMVQSGATRAFTEKVVERVNKLRVGDGMEEGTDIGPLINKAGFEKVRRHVRNALDNGGELVAGPHPDELNAEDNLFYPATVVTGITQDMDCCKEETFGPFVPILEFETADQAIELANHTEAGLAAYTFSGDSACLDYVIPRLSFGHVGRNTGNSPTPEAAFGGMKQSGLGREGGVEGFMEYVEIQTVPDGD